ncbi:MAG TPA: type III pantothenate kinase [Candidatus Omnitrophota bacterium]|nr:type III pantothenate kinase [Candidatus Omnitrophota bacterium]HRZ14779.1 type III pantothenate kinase [Candidatus Omnitrophota bacterium]
MLLAIDVGNSNLTFGIFKKNNRPVSRASAPTYPLRYGQCLAKLFRRSPIDAVIISSVVPAATQALKKELKHFSGARVHFLGGNLQVPIKNNYRFPEQVGQDRLVNAYAAVKLYGAPAVVVDFGTAITFDLISRRKEYLGGLILPGMRISLETLEEKTALLPKILLKKPEEFIGRDTANSMLSGIVYGYAALTDELTARIRKLLGTAAPVIGTGGNIKLIAPYCRRFTTIDMDLTLKGLKLIHDGVE